MADIIAAFAAITLIAGSGKAFSGDLDLWSDLRTEMVEIEILDHIVFEARAAVLGARRVAESIVLVEENCKASQDKVHQLLGSITQPSPSHITRLRKRIGAKELIAMIGVYRNYAFLLRDLCADLKAETRTRSLMAALKRLDQEFIGSPSIQSQALLELQENDFCVVAYVKAVHLHTSEDQHIRAIPGKLKFDTVANVDHVSREFLLGALGLDESMWKSIPEEDQVEITGFQGKTYTPKHHVELQWSRRDGDSFTKVEFRVIEGCPYEMVLSSRHFLNEPEAWKQIKMRLKGHGEASKSDKERRRAEAYKEIRKDFNRRVTEAHERQLASSSTLQGSEQRRSLQQTATVPIDELQDDQEPTPRDRDGSDKIRRQPTTREELRGPMDSEDLPNDGAQNHNASSEPVTALPSPGSQTNGKARHAWLSMTGLRKKSALSNATDKGKGTCNGKARLTN